MDDTALAADHPGAKSPLADVRKLTLYGLGLRDVSAVARAPTSRCSRWWATSRDARAVRAAPPLTEPWRRNVADAAELAHLRPLRLLHTLWLQDNPIASNCATARAPGACRALRVLDAAK